MNAIQDAIIQNGTDHDGNPTGGRVDGVGLMIQWQNGPLGRAEARRSPNGAFVETVISAAMQRLEFYQQAAGGKFSCEENASAIWHLSQALIGLESRTKAREARQVEGTHTA